LLIRPNTAQELAGRKKARARANPAKGNGGARR